MASGGCAQQQRLVLDVVIVGPQALVLAQPIVDPRALAPLALVDRPLQAAHVGEAAVLFGALVGDEPHTAHARVDLAAAGHANPTARSVPQLLWTGHRAGVGCHRQGTLPAHAAAEEAVFHQAL